MPTPSGLLKTNDIIINTKTNARWRVLQRLGNDEIYAVRMVPFNRGDLSVNDRSRGYAILTEAPYWLKNGWKVER